MYHESLSLEISKQRKHDVEQKMFLLLRGMLIPKFLNVILRRELKTGGRGDGWLSVCVWRLGERGRRCRDSLRSQDNYSTFSNRRAVTLAHPRSCSQRNRPQQEVCCSLCLTACGSFGVTVGDGFIHVN